MRDERSKIPTSPPNTMRNPKAETVQQLLQLKEAWQKLGVDFLWLYGVRKAQPFFIG